MGRCWGPPREFPPMTKVMQRRPDRQRWIRTRGIPWTCSSIYPKTKIYLLFIILCFSPPLLTLTGGYPRPPSSEKNQLRTLVNRHEIKCREPPREIPPMTRSCGRAMTSKADHGSRDSLDLLEHLPQNQNLSGLLFCACHQLFYH